MKTLLITLTILLPLFCNAQKVDLVQKAAEIKAEGMKLFYSEKASWISSDIFQAYYNYEIPQNFGGYFSYPDDTSVRSVYYSNDSTPTILLEFIFDKEFNEENILVSDVNRAFNDQEIDLYNMRNALYDYLRSDTSQVLYYQNVNFNHVYLNDELGRRIYMMMGVTEPNTVPLGNDYLLQMNDKYQITHTERIHQTYFPVKHESQLNDSVKGSIHTHIPGKDPFISPTDICISKLYAPITEWMSLVVVSEMYTSIWHDNKTLVIVPRKQK